MTGSTSTFGLDRACDLEIHTEKFGISVSSAGLPQVVQFVLFRRDGAGGVCHQVPTLGRLGERYDVTDGRRARRQRH